MCGRFTQHWTWAELRRAAEPFWEVPDVDAEPPRRFNLAPTQAAWVIRSVASGPSNAPAISPVRWGFERAGGGEVINARAETVATLPLFRDSARLRRCLVPAGGFFEWEATGLGSKQPWYLSPERDGPDGDDWAVFFLAGLWTPGGAADRFVTLTTDTPRGFEPAIHHRMPVVVRPEDAAAWLDPSVGADRALTLGAAFGAEGTFGVRAWPVSTRVNSAANEGATLLERAEPEAGLFG